jgi:hypothetical protein
VNCKRERMWKEFVVALLTHNPPSSCYQLRKTIYTPVKILGPRPSIAWRAGYQGWVLATELAQWEAMTRKSNDKMTTMKLTTVLVVVDVLRPDVQIGRLLHFVAERVASSWGLRFETQPEDRLHWLRFYVLYSCFSMKIRQIWFPST